MHRFYAAPTPSEEGKAFLTEEDARHALRVLRLSEGDTVELIRDGHRYQAVLDNTSEEPVSLRLLSELPSTEAALRVTLYQGVPKADKMEWIVQKNTEAGVHAIVPVLMERCVSRPDPKDGLKKAERWQKIAREAGKQSGRCLIPEVSAPVSFRELPALLARHDAVIVPWENQEGHGPKAFYATHDQIRSLGILIGPEGGISEKEISELQALSCTPVTLGPRILRTETAGLAALCAILCLYNEME